MLYCMPPCISEGGMEVMFIELKFSCIEDMLEKAGIDGFDYDAKLTSFSGFDPAINGCMGRLYFDSS